MRREEEATPHTDSGEAAGKTGIKNQEVWNGMALRH